MSSASSRPANGRRALEQQQQEQQPDQAAAEAGGENQELPLLLLGTRSSPSPELWKYAAIALLDLAANYVAVVSLGLTSVVSFTLISSFHLPATMILSWWTWGTTYTRRQLAAAALALGGLALLMTTHGSGGGTAPSNEESSQAPNPSSGGGDPRTPGSLLLGDALVALSACLFAMMNVAQEVLVKSVSPTTYLAKVASFASFFAFLIMGTAERATVRVITHEAGLVAWGYFAAFTAGLAVFYMLVPLGLQRSSAVVMNLNLITQQLWAFLAEVLVFDGQLSFQLFASAALVGTGLTVFSLEDLPSPPASAGGALPSESGEGTQTISPTQPRSSVQADESSHLIAHSSAASWSRSPG